MVALLEAAEEGRLGAVDVLELTACPQGCFGSPLLREDGVLGRHRWRLFEEAAGLPAGGYAVGTAAGAEPSADLRARQGGANHPVAQAVARLTPFRPRAGLRLDEDMAAAMAKLARLDALARALPGRDCGVCGAPACAALAEDVVLGRAAEKRLPLSRRKTMRLSEISRQLELRCLTPELGEERDVVGGHASDLLSDVLANAADGGLLVTMQVHMNVIAVALHAGLAAVIFTTGMVPEEAVRQKAVAERLPLFAARQSTFEVAGRLYALGVRGCSNRPSGPEGGARP